MDNLKKINNALIKKFGSADGYSVDEDGTIRNADSEIVVIDGLEAYYTDVESDDAKNAVKIELQESDIKVVQGLDDVIKLLISEGVIPESKFNSDLISNLNIRKNKRLLLQ